MEARRNLESILKRRLDESEKKRLQTELQLMVVKQYLSLLDYDNTNDLSGALGSILDRMDKLQDELKNLMSGSRSSTDSSAKNYDDAIKLSKLQLDEIHFHPQSIRINALTELVSHTFESGKIDLTVEEKLRDACVSLDYKVFLKILKGAIKLFDDTVKDYKITINQEKSTSLLKLMFDSETLRFIAVPFSTAEAVFNEQTSAQTVLDEPSVLIFILKGLCQCTGGDFLLRTPTTLELSVSCEIVPNDQCLIDTDQILHLPVDTLPSSSSSSPNVPTVPNVPIVSKPIPIPENIPEPEPEKEVPRITPEPIPSPVSVPTATSQHQKTLSGKVIRILLAEDGKVLQELFKRFWSMKGHEVLIASNGQEAIEIFKSKTISIVFLDIEMPLKDGLTVSREIRAFEAERQVPRTPIIGVSGYALKSYKEKALESGMDDFVSKGSGYPFKEIYDLVVRYCGE